MSDESEGWYIRAKGRVLGPFAQAQVESMRDRGQISQFHEVSRDRRNWLTASKVEWLFSPAPIVEPSYEGLPLAGAVRSSGPAWYYDQSGAPIGPLTAEQMTDRIRSGLIPAGALFWKEGDPAWRALRDIPEFAQILPAAQGPSIGPAPSTGAAPPKAWRRRLVPLWFVGGLLLLGVLTGLALFAVHRHRSAAPLGLVGAPDIPAPGTGYVDSHMSERIAQATGLVVAGATITDLNSGEVVEVPGSRGTCFAIDARGYLLTNRHVVEEFVNLTRADARIAELERKVGQQALEIDFLKGCLQRIEEQRMLQALTGNPQSTGRSKKK